MAKSLAEKYAEMDDSFADAILRGITGEKPAHNPYAAARKTMAEAPKTKGKKAGKRPKKAARPPR